MKVSRPFGRGVMLMVTLLFVLTVSARAGTCYNVCEWVSWKTWGQCSQSCGGGVRERTRDLCCPKNSFSATSCLLRCSKSKSGAKETGSCNTYCCRGEYRRSINACNCPATYTGACCEQIYIQPGHNTISTSATPPRPTSLYDFCPGARDYDENTGNAFKPPGLVFICSYVIIVRHYFRM